MFIIHFFEDITLQSIGKTFLLNYLNDICFNVNLSLIYKFFICQHLLLEN